MSFYVCFTSVRMQVFACENSENVFVTTVPNAEAVGEPVDIATASPGCHINEEVG